MSTNYNILLKSEKKLKELIAAYLVLVLDIHRKLWLDSEKFSEQEKNLIFDNTERRQKRSLAMEDELLDECIWTISKDDPRANHLRFIISIIQSTKDLSRSCEYAMLIAKIIVRNNLNNSIIKHLKPVIKLYLTFIENSVKVYKSTSNNKLDVIDEISQDFEAKFEKSQKETRKIFANDEILQYQINQIFRLMLSTIERLQSIFSSIMVSKSNTMTLDVKKNKKS